MKQTILTVLLTLSVTFGAFYGAAQAGLLDSMLNSDLPEVATTANYEISTYGWDSRVYEWTPAGNPAYTCVFVAANKSSGAACFPKASAQ